MAHTFDTATTSLVNFEQMSFLAKKDAQDWWYRDWVLLSSKQEAAKTTSPVVRPLKELLI
jgi:hypothetical protein